MKALAYILIFIALLGGFVGCHVMVGAGAWGPTNRVTVTVTRAYIDVSGGKKKTESHYMVATDQGVFEVDNGWMLNVWNADELYGRLQPGKRYTFTTKGNKVVNPFMQEYPYVTEVVPLP